MARLLTKANGLLLETRRLSRFAVDGSAIPGDDSSSVNSFSDELKSSVSLTSAFSKGATQIIPLTIGTTVGDRAVILKPMPLSRCLKEDLGLVNLILNDNRNPDLQCRSY